MPKIDSALQLSKSNHALKPFPYKGLNTLLSRIGNAHQTPIVQTPRPKELASNTVAFANNPVTTEKARQACFLQLQANRTAMGACAGILGRLPLFQ